MGINPELSDICYFLGGFVSAYIIFVFYLNNVKKEIKNLKRQYEKKSIGMDDSSLKVKTLESKVKTLETALKKQIEKE